MSASQESLLGSDAPRRTAAQESLLGSDGPKQSAAQEIASFVSASVRRTAIQNAESTTGQVLFQNDDGSVDVTLMGGGVVRGLDVPLNSPIGIESWVTLQRAGKSWTIAGPAPSNSETP